MRSARGHIASTCSVAGLITAKLDAPATCRPPMSRLNDWGDVGNCGGAFIAAPKVSSTSLLHNLRRGGLQQPARDCSEIRVLTSKAGDLHAQGHIVDDQQGQIEGGCTDCRGGVVVPRRSRCGLTEL